jgi:hypothetical protein
MAGYSNVLVLVADEASAVLSANTDGFTRNLRTIDRTIPMAKGDLYTRYDFACQLMMVLHRIIGENDYDGVLIFADAPMMEELRRVKTERVSRALIAEIVGKPGKANAFPALSAATAQLAYRDLIV